MTFLPQHHERPEGVFYDEEQTQEEIRTLKDIFSRSRPAFESLAMQLRKPIHAGRWTSILADDISGRLPALVLGGLMERVAKERGEKAPGRFFIAGPREKGDMEERNLKEYVHALKERLGPRTLLVTEYIQSGETISRLASLLKEEGIEFDVGVLSYNPEHHGNLEEARKMRERFEGTQFYVGDTSNEPGTRFWEQKKSTGIEKSAYPYEPTASRNFWADPEVVHRAREMAGELADELYEKYFGNGDGGQEPKAE